MPAALKVDWDRAKLLRFQGLTYKEIAETIGVSLGCITTRGSREKWSIKQAQVRAELADSVVAKVKGSLAERAQEWSERIIQDVESSASIATKLRKPKSRKGLREHEELMTLHTKRGRTMFGLDQESASINITIGIPRGMQVKRVEDAQDHTDDASSDAPGVEPPAIDV